MTKTPLLHSRPWAIENLALQPCAVELLCRPTGPTSKLLRDFTVEGSSRLQQPAYCTVYKMRWEPVRTHTNSFKRMCIACELQHRHRRLENSTDDVRHISLSNYSAVRTAVCIVNNRKGRTLFVDSSKIHILPMRLCMCVWHFEQRQKVVPDGNRKALAYKTVGSVQNRERCPPIPQMTD